MKTKIDPTGQAKNRARGEKALSIRLSNSRIRIMRLFRTIPRTRKQRTDIRNEQHVTTVYDYDISAAESLALAGFVASILNDELLQSQLDPPPRWYWRTIIERSYASGTAEEVVIFNQLINSAGVKAPTTGFPLGEIKVQDVLLSPEYRQALAGVLADNTNSIKTLSQTTASQVMTQINLGIDAGDSPRVISQAIQKRFDVAKSSADRIAQTEINKAYTDAKMGFGDIASERTGMRAGVIHISALIPTTRSWHASRHGNAYTTAQQRKWWNNNHNRIRCHCDVISVLIDSKGNVVDLEMQKRIQAEKSFFDTEDTTGQKPKPKAKVKPKPKVKTKPKKAPKPKIKPIEQPKPSKATVEEIKKAKPAEKITKVSKSEKPKVAEDQKLTPKDGPPKIKDRKFTGDEETYLEYYKGDGFYKSNEVLRNPSSFSSVEVDSASKMRDSINSAIAKSEITEGGSLYRGMKSSDIFENAEKLIGKSIPISTPQSTASNAGSSLSWAGLIRNKKGEVFTANKGQSVIFKINTKKGQHAINLESLSIGNTGEREILLASGGRYNVKSVRELKDSSGNVSAKVIEVDYDE